jgi:hypothetical protein
MTGIHIYGASTPETQSYEMYQLGNILVKTQSEDL